MKRVISARCDWTPLQQSYDLDAIIRGANARRAHSVGSSDLPYPISSCGRRTTLLHFADLWEGGEHFALDLQLASDGKRYFVHVGGTGDCEIEESEVRSQIERYLAELPLTGDARRELLGIIRVTTKSTVKNVTHNPFM